jgi:DNA-binding CsgD family transcriptional regulator
MSLSELTPRQTEVLGLLADGLDQRAIADKLVISHKTVGKHIEHILMKLGATSRAQAVALAYQQRHPPRRRRGGCRSFPPPSATQPPRRPRTPPHPRRSTHRHPSPRRRMRRQTPRRTRPHVIVQRLYRIGPRLRCGCFNLKRYHGFTGRPDGLARPRFGGCRHQPKPDRWIGR